jgi:preprotein translocase subunit SecA
MGKLGIKEDEPIENRLITKSLESAQQKIEGFNFDARKHVLEFDDVLNFQRKIMYGRRREILVGDENFVRNYVEGLIVGALPEIKEQIEKRIQKMDESYLRNLKSAILQTTDMFWVEHLEVMDYMRSSVNLRAYGQRDPLVEYKREGLKLFKEMEQAIADEIIKIIPQIKEEKGFFAETVKLTETREFDVPVVVGAPTSTPLVDGEKIGRNDPCFCGSGKKYKKCGEINSEEHQKLMANKG